MISDEIIESGYVEPYDFLDLTYTKWRREEMANGYIHKQMSGQNGYAPTVLCQKQYGVVVMDNNEKKNLRIRRLTPNECWRLMGFDDEDFEKARPTNSDAQLYKQAGNSIVVNCLEAIFKNLFPEEIKENG